MIEWMLFGIIMQLVIMNLILWSIDRKLGKDQ